MNRLGHVREYSYLSPPPQLDVSAPSGANVSREVREDETERKIDRDLEDSFPASDPPGWTLGVERPDRESHDGSVDSIG